MFTLLKSLIQDPGPHTLPASDSRPEADADTNPQSPPQPLLETDADTNPQSPPQPLLETDADTNRQSPPQPLLESDADTNPQSPPQPLLETDADRNRPLQPLPKADRRKRPLTEAEKDMISRIFKDLITSNETVLVNTIRTRMKEEDELRPLLSIKGMEIKVADRVRRCQAVEPRVAPEELPSEQKESRVTDWLEFEAEIVSPSEASSRQEWDTDDTKVIEFHFLSLSKCPKKHEILAIFDGNDTLREVLNRNGKKRCLDKVKNLFKRLSKKKR